MDQNHTEICIIGAGMAGLACATQLQAAGHDVIVLDKGRGPGGRMAARRAEIAGETVSFDHGAQYFTARDDGFRQAVEAWEKAGVVARWNAAGKDAFVGTPGMNGPIKAMAESLDVRWNMRALSLSRVGDEWRIETEAGALFAKTVLVAIPAEQAHELLKDAAPEFSHVAGGTASLPCWAVMAAFEQPIAYAPDTFRAPDAAVSWAARNSAKPGREGKECWVIHASPSRSLELIDMSKEEAGAVILADFFAQTTSAPAKPVHLAAHRWLYAMAEAVEGEPARYDAAQRIGIAGDYLHSPRVEGAWISGYALARKVIG